MGVAQSPAIGKEAGQELRTLLFPHPTDNLGTVVETTVPQHIPQGSGRSVLRIPGSKDDPIHPRKPRRTSTHRARLEGDSQRHPAQPPFTNRRCCRTDRHNFCMGRRIPINLTSIATHTYDQAIRGHHHGTDWNITLGQRNAGLL
jgi:hypothetical protein